MAGTEFLSNEQPEKAKLNQKTTFVDIGTNIAALATTYPGQMAYATTTSGGFTIDTLYVRNAANSAWVTIKTMTDNLTESATATLGNATGSTSATVISGTRYYSFFTLPTTDPLYIFTNITWKNGTTVTGSTSVATGIDLVSSITTPVAGVQRLAVGQSTTQAGTSAEQSCTNVASTLVRGGTLCGVWVACNNSTTHLIYNNAASSITREKVATFTTDDQAPAAADALAWSAANVNERWCYATYRSYY